MYTQIRFGQPFCDFSRLCIYKKKKCTPTGAASQDKNLPPVPASQLRWKPPDKVIMINKTAVQKSSLEIKK